MFNKIIYQSEFLLRYAIKFIDRSFSYRVCLKSQCVSMVFKTLSFAENLPNINKIVLLESLKDSSRVFTVTGFLLVSLALFSMIKSVKNSRLLEFFFSFFDL